MRKDDFLLQHLPTVPEKQDTATHGDLGAAGAPRLAGGLDRRKRACRLALPSGSLRSLGEDTQRAGALIC